MAHDHPHDHHDHDHGHHHGHHHAGDHDGGNTEMAFEEKVARLLDHWVKHNDDHAVNYREWAQKVRDARMPRVAELLEEAAEMTGGISERLVAAARLLE